MSLAVAAGCQGLCRACGKQLGVHRNGLSAAYLRRHASYPLSVSSPPRHVSNYSTAHGNPPGHHHDHKIRHIKGAFTKTPQLETDPSLIRNIGVVAHIDAGKTTTTERMLFLSGATKHVGDVDSGDTVTDYMEQERERGITIQSAAITFYWRQHRLNLIDTPGHVDFTVEVERCLRVLDGVVTVLDASAGVEAQTLTVWKQATKYNVPSVVFVNKMDKSGANFDACLRSIESKLHVVPLPLFRPVLMEQNGFVGVRDLVGRKVVQFSGDEDESGAVVVEPTPSDTHYDLLHSERSDLLERLAELDDHFAEKLLSSDGDDAAIQGDILPAVRRATLARKAVPVGCGAALRNMGVSNVLDMAVNFLPSPMERRHNFVDFYENELCALAFKVTHDKRKGPLTYVRVYSGKLVNNASIFNASRRVTESNVKVFIPHSDQLQDVSAVSEGNIAVLTGLQHTVTGDTIVKSEKSAKRAAHKHHAWKVAQHKSKHGHGINASHIDHTEFDQEDDGSVVLEATGEERHGLPPATAVGLVLAGIDPPDPVFFCSIEPPTAGGMQKFEKALAELSIEDPSLRFRKDTDRNQTVLEGMGELHIEIVKERLKREYGLEVFVGRLQVNYKERLDGGSRAVHTLTDTVQDREQSITLDMSVVPKKGTGKFYRVLVSMDDPNAIVPTRQWREAINDGCTNALRNGPSIGFPVQKLQGVKVLLHGFNKSGRRPNLALLSACANVCLNKALSKVGSTVLEPVMSVEVTVYGSESDESLPTHGVLKELGKRRGQVLSVDGDGTSYATIRALAPLADLTGFASAMRSSTHGLASLHMELAGYQPLSAADQRNLLNRVHAGELV